MPQTFLQRLDEDALTAGEPVEAAHFEGVSRPEVVEAGKPLRAVRDAAGFAVVDEYPFAAGGAQLGLLRVGVLLALGDSGVADFVRYAENGTADVPARFGFGRGFRRIILRRVVQLVVGIDEAAENDGGLNPPTHHEGR